jgi:hypothetical protein
MRGVKVWTPASTNRIAILRLAWHTRLLLREFMLSAGMEVFYRKIASGGRACRISRIVEEFLGRSVKGFDLPWQIG